jgi:hypothetical protein
MLKIECGRWSLRHNLISKAKIYTVEVSDNLFGKTSIVKMILNQKRKDN